MNTRHISLAELASRDNLVLALWKAARGRRGQPAVQRFLAHADQRLDALAAAIGNASAPSGQTRHFQIHDPKRRTISAPCFADRVLHHAVLNLAEARFEQALVPSSYARRPGRGVHAGVLAVQRGMQRWPWFVQVDVASYFASIRHDLLLALLRTRFRGADFLALLERIVRVGAADAGVGLPIGALTSQHFANAYLDAADRWLLAQGGVSCHVRYMDDIVWWCADEQQALHTLQVFSTWLWDARALRLKPGALPRPSAGGITWCGFDITPAVIRPGPRKRSRYRNAVSRLIASQRLDLAGEQHLQRAHDGLLATLAGSNSLLWRREQWRECRFGDVDDQE